jgi:hypothetical protein
MTAIVMPMTATATRSATASQAKTLPSWTTKTIQIASPLTASPA